MSDPQVLDVQRHIWTIGDYSRIARRLVSVSERVVGRLSLSPGDTVLDVAVGDGNAALLAARAGAVVTGVDLTPAQLDKARRRSRDEGLEIDLREGNAEALDSPDGSFDAVMSVFGVIFAPDHAAATAEMARVCRRGGTVAMTSWTAGWSGRLFARVSHLLPPPPPGGPRPDEWGDPDEAVRRLAAAGLDAVAEIVPFHWEFPTIDEFVDFLLATSGPFIAMAGAAEAAGHGGLVASALRDVMGETNEATDGTCRIPAPYVLAVATRP